MRSSAPADDGLDVVTVRRFRPISATSTSQPGPWSPLAAGVFWVVVALLAGIVVLSGLRAVTGWGLSGPWLPTGDDAFLAMRARDVFSSHPPLLSTASSGGATAGIEYNHPGPLLLYLIAPFVVALGSSGAALGSALVNGSAIVAAGWMLRRCRPATAAIVMAGVAGLVWTMGSALVVDPWNPNAATLPFLTLCIAALAVWSARPLRTMVDAPAGSAAALPIGVCSGSMVAQTHLAFVPVTAAVGVALVVGGLVLHRAGDLDRRRDVRRAFVASAVIGVVTCIPMIVDTIADGTDSNIFRIARGGDFDGPLVTAGTMLRLVADKVVLPPWFLRGSWLGPLFALDLPSTTISVVAVIAFVGLVVLSMVAALRRHDRQVGALGSIGLLVLLAGSVGALSFPLRVGIPMPYLRWLWVAGLLLAATLLVRPLEIASRWLGDRGGLVAIGVGAAAVAVLAVLSIPWYGDEASGSPEPIQDISRSMLDQARPELERLDRVLVEPSGQWINLAFTPALIDELDAMGVDVGLRDPVLVQQSGRHRRARGDEPWVLVTAGLGQDPPTGGRLIASHTPLRPEEQRELERSTAEVVDQLRAGSVSLTPVGREYAEAADLDTWIDLARTNPEAFVSNRLLATYLDAGFFHLEGVDESLLRKVSEKGSTAHDFTTGLWLVPGDAWRREHSS